MLAMTATHDMFMEKALQAAAPWLGAASPNPSVGAAVFDEQGRFLASAAHVVAGQSHAEARVLDICRNEGTFTRMHTLAVTLEPCNHHGRTPPCTDLILSSPIRRVIVGPPDPHPVARGGLKRLENSGRTVIANILPEKCWHQMAGFMVRQLTARPLMILKIAINAEGSMIPPRGQKTFTGKATLTLSHRLRKRTDAILTGSGTVVTDQPLFTVRYVPDYANKKRHIMVMDRRGRVNAEDMAGYYENGFITHTSDNLDQAIRDLGGYPCNSVLIEAGPQTCKKVLEQNLWDILVILKRYPDGTDKVFAGRNPTKALLNPLEPFNIFDFLPDDPDAPTFAYESVSDPADTLRQFSDLSI